MHSPYHSPFSYDAFALDMEGAGLKVHDKTLTLAQNLRGDDISFVPEYLSCCAGLGQYVDK